MLELPDSRSVCDDLQHFLCADALQMHADGRNVVTRHDYLLAFPWRARRGCLRMSAEVPRHQGLRPFHSHVPKSLPLSVPRSSAFARRGGDLRTSCAGVRRLDLCFLTVGAHFHAEVRVQQGNIELAVRVSSGHDRAGSPAGRRGRGHDASAKAIHERPGCPTPGPARLGGVAAVLSRRVKKLAGCVSLPRFRAIWLAVEFGLGLGLRTRASQPCSFVSAHDFVRLRCMIARIFHEIQ